MNVSHQTGEEQISDLVEVPIYLQPVSGAPIKIADRCAPG